MLSICLCRETVGDVQGVKFSGVEGYAQIKPEMEVFADLTVEEVAADAFKEEDEEDNVSYFKF